MSTGTFLSIWALIGSRFHCKVPIFTVWGSSMRRRAITVTFTWCRGFKQATAWQVCCHNRDIFVFVQFLDPKTMHKNYTLQLKERHNKGLLWCYSLVLAIIIIIIIIVITIIIINIIITQQKSLSLIIIIPQVKRVGGELWVQIWLCNERSTGTKLHLHCIFISVYIVYAVVQVCINM